MSVQKGSHVLFHLCTGRLVTAPKKHENGRGRGTRRALRSMRQQRPTPSAVGASREKALIFGRQDPVVVEVPTPPKHYWFAARTAHAKRRTPVSYFHPRVKHMPLCFPSSSLPFPSLYRLPSGGREPGAIGRVHRSLPQLRRSGHPELHVRQPLQHGRRGGAALPREAAAIRGAAQGDAGKRPPLLPLLLLGPPTGVLFVCVRGLCKLEAQGRLKKYVYPPPRLMVRDPSRTLRSAW